MRTHEIFVQPEVQHHDPATKRSITIPAPILEGCLTVKNLTYNRKDSSGEDETFRLMDKIVALRQRLCSLFLQLMLV